MVTIDSNLMLPFPTSCPRSFARAVFRISPPR